MSIKSFGLLSCVIVVGMMSVATGQEGGTAKPAAAAKPASKLSLADQRFIKEAVQGGMSEVELGQLAVEKGSSEEVRKFGQQMVDDHTKANDRLKELATSKGINLPKTPNVTQKATKSRLAKLSGEQFDKAYVADMLRDHKRDVAAFQTESNLAHDVDVKNFATLTLPTVRDHLKEAESMAPKPVEARGGMAPKKPEQQ
jgi:putative membrane protein